MIKFDCDYSEGCHPNILKKMIDTNFVQTDTYGFDVYCQSAIQKIRKACGKPNARVYFAVGGTQANKVVIASILRPHQGVICAESGHINVHEAGAIESDGHKVIALAQKDGKLTAATLKAYLEDFWADPTHPHRVQPRMVYISSPTELGTLYSKKELQEISSICKKYKLVLYLDGARLGYGLQADGADFTLRDIANLTDVFYIGGTKVGALCGEAIVFPKDNNLDEDFFSIFKQEGAVMAKGRLLGIQFDVLFTDNLYETVGRHAIKEAMRIKKAFKAKGIKFAVNSPTNQQFPILPKEVIKKFKKQFVFDIAPDLGQDRLMTRFCTSWATKPEDVDVLIKEIENI